MPQLNRQAMRAARDGFTPCSIQPGPGKVCYEPAHVVHYAPADMVIGGRRYRPGEKILSCLTHGGQIYDAIHRRLTNTPAWLLPVVDTGCVPVVRMPYHRSESAPAWSTRAPKQWTSRR